MTRQTAAVSALIALTMAGCEVGPKYKAPTVQPPPQFKEANPELYKEANGWKPAQPSDEKLKGTWWEIFGDSDLSALESQIDVSNQNLKIAQARFEQARALIKFNRSGLFPTITVGSAVTANRQSANRVFSAPATTKNYGDFILPIDASYEADVWGRIRRSIEAARTAAQANAADVENVRLSLHAELAYDYFELRGLDAEQKLLNDTVQTFQKALELTTNRFEGGVANRAEVAQAETQLKATQALAKDISIQRAQYEHAIAALIGKAPAEFSLAARPTALEPPQIPVGIPSSLLERRPDVAAAERRVAAANERYGIALAAFYPSVMISSSIGLEGSSITNWMNWPARFWAVGPSILQTVFDGGRRRANSQAALADYDANVATYRQTTLDAFQQVEDNLAALRILADEAKTQQEAVAAAKHSLELSTNRYTGGLVTYLEVVTAQSTALSNQRTEVDIMRRRMVASVLLVKALGGGWDASQLPKLDR